MKILFFSPTLAASAIGRASALVVRELLLRGNSVVVVRAEDPTLQGGPMHPFSCPTISWTNADMVRQHAEGSNLILYQIGDNFMYHRGCMDWLPIFPGLVCLHDNFLGHLFWSCSEKMGRPKAQQLLANAYGKEVSHRFFDHASSSSFIAYASEAAPMTEWISSMAKAVIVHSSWAINRVTSSCPGPVEVVPLPYDAPFLDVTHPDTPVGDPERLVILTVGRVNPNKRYASVIEAIGSSPWLRSRITYRVVGAAEPDMVATLNAQAKQFGVNLTLTGEVDSLRLATEIAKADIMCCLRWPALESASASTIEAMLYGKAIVVTNTGFYRDLPNDCVLKVSPHNEISELTAAIDQLLRSPLERQSLGSSAKQYALKTFRVDTYAERIVAMVRRIDCAAVTGKAAHVFSDTLKVWGLKGDSKALDTIVAPLAPFK